MSSIEIAVVPGTMWSLREAGKRKQVKIVLYIINIDTEGDLHDVRCENGDNTFLLMTKSCAELHRICPRTVEAS